MKKTMKYLFTLLIACVSFIVLFLILAWGYEKSTKIPFRITLFLAPVLVAVWLYFAGGKFWGDIEQIDKTLEKEMKI